jgi:DNA-binding transcriptional ArsR family regulator
MSTERIDAVFSALADPTRRAILSRLMDGEASVTELAEPFAMSLPAISKHIRVLERAGLISRGKQAQFRPCRLDGTGLKDLAEWLEFYRAFYDESIERLGDYLRQVQGMETEDDADRH